MARPPAGAAGPLHHPSDGPPPPQAGEDSAGGDGAISSPVHGGGAERQRGGGGQSANHRIRIAFVATNSIVQGEQVAQLWPLLFDRHGLEIAFAHRTFSWGSEARGKAHVHVVIVGLAHRDHEPAEKRLFSYPDIKGSPVESRRQAIPKLALWCARYSELRTSSMET